MRCVPARALIWLGFCTVGACAWSAEIARASDDTMTAEWREQRVDFDYRGRTARYSCAGLRDKMRALLLELGARSDLEIVTLGCDAAERLRLVFSVPGLVDKAGKPVNGADRPLTAARFVSFTIERDAFRNMGIGDCELVQDFTRQVLPKFVTRNLKQDIACAMSGPNGSRFWVHGDVLKVLTPGAAAPAQQPLKGP